MGPQLPIHTRHPVERDTNGAAGPAGHQFLGSHLGSHSNRQPKVAINSSTIPRGRQARIFLTMASKKFVHQVEKIKVEKSRQAFQEWVENLKDGAEILVDKTLL